MESILAPNHGRFQRAFTEMASLEAPDARTVVITLNRPYAPLLSLLTVFDAPVLPKHVYEGTDPLTNPVNEAPIGSGPFRFVEWVRGERVVLERFDDYFLEPALLDRADLPHVPQDVARSTAIEVGEADLLWGFYMPTSDLARLEANPDVNVWKGLTIPALYFMFMNTDHPALADVRVRQALMHAVDRDQIVAQAQGGLGEVAGGPFGSALPLRVRRGHRLPHPLPVRPRARPRPPRRGRRRRPHAALRLRLRPRRLRGGGRDHARQPAPGGHHARRAAGRALGDGRARLRPRLRPDAAVLHLGRRPGDRLPPHLPVGGTRHQLRQRHRLRRSPRWTGCSTRPRASPTRRARRAVRRRDGDPRAQTCPRCRSSTSSPPRRRRPT